MRLPTAITGLLVVLSVTAVPSFAAPKKDLVKTQLLADTTAIAPGTPFTVGIVFDIAQSWHIYWTNPGDAGEPTEIEWTLPDGFKVSDLQFPLPHKFVMPGNIRSYGYSTQVMLTATITPPADFKEQSVTIGAHATWLVCESVCIPGEEKLTLTLPVVANPDDIKPSPSAETIAQWAASVPTTVDDADLPLKSLHAAVKKQGDESVLTITIQKRQMASKEDQKKQQDVKLTEKERVQIQSAILKQRQLPLRERLALRKALLKQLDAQRKKAEGIPADASDSTTQPIDEPKFEWFPPDSEQAKFADAVFDNSNEHVLSITVHIKPLLGQKMPDSTLMGVLSYRIGEDPTESVAVQFNPSGGTVAGSASANQ